jgi:transposase
MNADLNGVINILHIPESQGEWNEGSTRGIGGKMVEDPAFGLPLDEWSGVGNPH